MPNNASNDSSQRKAAEQDRLGADYAKIEQALLETPRGRWFLAQYARRNRGADTQMLLEAITKLEFAVLGSQGQQGPCVMLSELLELREAIARTRREVAALKLPDQPESQLVSATEELDQIVEVTEKATFEILQAAEEIQEVAWMLRERGVDAGFCDRLDHRATNIYTACSFQDITGQRTEKVVKVLRVVEQRLNTMIEIWGGDTGVRSEGLRTSQRDGEAAPLNAPRPEGAGLRQADVDAMLDAPPPSLEQTRLDARSATEEPVKDAPPEQEVASGATQTFEAPEPLRLDTLHAVKRAALFG